MYSFRRFKALRPPSIPSARRGSFACLAALSTVEGVVQPVPINRTPKAFATLAEALRAVHSTPQVRIEEIAAPGRLAPWAVAFSAQVTAEGTFLEDDAVDDLATGRIVVLYDPAAPEEWQGPFRIVSYIRAELEDELAAEPMLGHVAWTWLTDALDGRDCDVTAVGGTTTKVISESFGTLAQRPTTVDLELRASWTPVLEDPADISEHVEAWVELIMTVAGLPPMPEGVSPFPGRRR